MKRLFIRLVLICIALMAFGAIFTSISHAKVDPKSIVGIWLLDEGKGTDMEDLSPNGNHGKVVDAEWIDGWMGKALEFDGANHAEIPASASTDNYVEAFTYLLWVMPSAAPPNGNTRVMERDWHNPAIQIGASDFYGSTMIAAVQDNSNIRGGTWEIGEWTFVALTWDGGTLSLYVNDKMVAEKKLGKPDFSKNNAGGAIWLAQWKGGAGWDFKGAIDEVGVFSAALSADDLADIMNNGLGKATGVTAVSKAGKMAVAWGAIKN